MTQLTSKTLPLNEEIEPQKVLKKSHLHKSYFSKLERKSKMTLSILLSNIETAHGTFQAKALQSASVNLTLRNFVIVKK